ncbi:MAG: DUF2807 domain-containing protein [Ekhidna sp.]
MKPLITAFLFILTASIGVAQGNSTIALQQFTELKVYDRISVTLVPGNENKIVIRSEHKKDIGVTEGDGHLRLKLATTDFLGATTVNVQLHYTEALSVINANKNSRIISTGMVKGTSLTIEAQDASTITLNVAYDDITAKSTSGSEIKLSGTATYQNVTTNTGGKALNKGLKTKNSLVMVLAGGFAEIHATEKAVAKVKAGGAITIYGHPKIIDKDDTFGGKIAVIE